MKISVIMGSTRPGRFSEYPAQWVMEALKSNLQIEAELVDLRDYPMPFYEEAKTPKQLNGSYPNETVARFAQKIKDADGFIIVAPEYNHGYPAVLKNAMDSVFIEWNNKAVAFVSYGSVGGARAIEQLRQVAVELQMAPIRNSVHITNPWNLMVQMGGLQPGALEPFNGARDAMIDQLVWWTAALASARKSS